MVLVYDDCINGTNLPADIAFDAFFLVYAVYFIGFEGYGIRGTALCAFRTANAFIIDGIADNGRAFSCRATAINMCFIFMPEIPQR
jgi:hypothetical protein